MLLSPSCRPSTNLNHLVSITEKFLQSGRLADLLWLYCQAAPSDSPQLRETLLGRIVALPDLTANRLHPNNKPLFLPQQYYSLLATEMLSALERTCQALRGEGTSAFSNNERFCISVLCVKIKSTFSVCLCETDGTDCSLTFVAQTLGKACIQGHSGEFIYILCTINRNLSLFSS